MNRKTLDLLFKITVRSVIDYALPIYANTLKPTELARTGALQFTSKEKLNIELGWETIKKRIEFLGLSLFQKIHLHETRPLIRNCLSKLDYEKTFVSRSKGGYVPYPNYGNKFMNSFFPFISKLWNNLTPLTKTKDLIDFKNQLKIDIKPIKIRFYAHGSKLGNSLLSRIRTGRTLLNLDKYTLRQVDEPTCACHAKQESAIHFLMDCFLYTAERRTLFNLVEHYVPKFTNLSKKAKFELLTTGLKSHDPEYDYLNSKITIAVQNFIINTKRFLQKD